MSTDTGDAAIVRDFVEQSKDLIRSGEAELRQADMFEPVSPEEMLEARAALGPSAGNIAVLAHARDRKRGRPAGSRNKRSDDFAAYILSFGQDPAITLMQIQSTPPEVLMEASRRVKSRHRRASGIQIDVTQTMTYGEAQALRVRCAEGLIQYIHSKQPVAVDMKFSGVADLFIAGVTHSQDEIDTILEGEFAEFEEARGADQGEAA